MGSYNSGRWHCHNKKMTVGACRSIDVRRVEKEHLAAVFAVDGKLYSSDTSPLAARILARKALVSLGLETPPPRGERERDGPGIRHRRRGRRS